MPDPETYGSYRNLPHLAGLCPFPEATKPGLGIEDCVERLKRYHYAYRRLWAIMLSRITAEPVYEIKMGFSHHAYLASETVTLMRERVAEMRHPPLGLDKVPHPALETFFDEIQAAPMEALLHGLYQKAHPAISQAFEQHLKDTNPLADAPSIRVIKMALADLSTMQAWGDVACQSFPATIHAAWLLELDQWLHLAGGVDGLEEATELDSANKCFSAKPFAMDHTPQRDERFLDPYNMGVHAEQFLYDDQYTDRDKVLMMFYKRFREIDVPEMMATILIDMANETGDEESGGRPWKFYQDMTRQLWDEARHAMMGEVGFVDIGIDWQRHVRLNFTWSKGLNQQLTPRERHAVLWFIEQGLMSKTGKRFEWEVGRDSGNPLSMLFQDYDWADEVLHARIGRDWYVKDFDSVSDAAAYGSACWDKVMTDWEQWRQDGLTEHHNWWPDLYRAACKLRGETPNSTTEAYSESYATTRADLERIAASG